VNFEMGHAFRKIMSKFHQLITALAAGFLLCGSFVEADEAGAQKVVASYRARLADWTQQTGDTIPENPTPNRRQPPRIVAGEIVRMGPKHGKQNPHAEFPGAAMNAAEMNHPGPIRVQSK
jgi:hypothetical protein